MPGREDGRINCAQSDQPVINYLVCSGPLYFNEMETLAQLGLEIFRGRKRICLDSFVMTSRLIDGDVSSGESCWVFFFFVVNWNVRNFWYILIYLMYRLLCMILIAQIKRNVFVEGMIVKSYRSKSGAWESLVFKKVTDQVTKIPRM